MPFAAMLRPAKNATLLIEKEEEMQPAQDKFIGYG